MKNYNTKLNLVPQSKGPKKLNWNIRDHSFEYNYFGEALAHLKIAGHQTRISKYVVEFLLSSFGLDFLLLLLLLLFPKNFVPKVLKAVEINANHDQRSVLQSKGKTTTN